MTQPEQTPNPKRRLGRGLSSLIINSAPSAEPEGAYQPAGEPEAPGESPDAPRLRSPRSVTSVAVSEISPNPYQPRQDFAEEDMTSLVESIRQQGILQPIVVTPRSGEDAERAYVVVAGERRLRAAKEAGLPAVPCIVRDATPQQMLEWALIENIQRTDLNPMERAEAYRQYVDRFELTQAEAGERLGVPRATIANYLRLLELQNSVQERVRQGELSFGHAKVLAALVGRGQAQQNLAKRTVEQGLSVRRLEELVAEALAAEGGRRQTHRKAKPPYLADLEEQLTQAAGTRVVIRPGRAKHSGRIVLEYYSLEDFDRLAGLLGAKLQG